MDTYNPKQLNNFPPGPEVTMGPHGYGPYPRAEYDSSNHGGRQLALLPVNGPHSMPQATGQYSQPWIYPQGQPISGFPSYGSAANNPWQSFIASWTANASTTHNFTITKHICANCGRLRSRKYQAGNPIIAGEVPTPAFCRKCQKDSSSTEAESDSSRTLKNHTKKSRKQSKVSIVSYVSLAIVSASQFTHLYGVK